MAGEKLLIVQTNGRQKQGPLLDSLTGGTDQDFDVTAGGGQSNFVVSTTFSSLNKIDVWVNGQLQREGASYDYQRNVSLNRIEFTYTVPQNAWVRVRLF